MTYDRDLADDLRAHLAGRNGLSEREMFGGIGFMINGNMAVGVSGGDLMVRVGKEAHDDALSEQGVRDFDMSGRAMRGWVLVSLAAEHDLGRWADRGIAFAESLPPK